MTSQVVDFVPVRDPLTRAAQLPFVAELPVLGVATEFRTNSRYVVGVIEEAFGVWRRAPTPSGGPQALVVRRMQSTTRQR